MKTLKQLLKESYDNYPLTESSLARVAYHATGSNLGIITAHRGCLSASDNNRRNEELKQMISKAGYGYIRVKGHYVEGHGTDEARDVHEHALMVIGKRGEDNHELVNHLRRWGEHFSQDSILHKRHNSEIATLHGTSRSAWPGYGKKEEVGKFHPNRVGEFYTALNNGQRTFVFSESADSNKQYPKVSFLFQENYFKSKERAEQMFFSIK